MTRVLITGGRAPAALELCRSLRSAGAEVFGAESRRDNVCAASRSVSRSFHVPPPRTERAAFLGELARIVSDHDIDWIIPTCEEGFYMARGRASLPDHARLFAPDFGLMARLHSKLEFVGLAREAGLEVPRTERVESRSALDRAIAERPDELVVKPEFSRFGTQAIVRPTEPVNVEVSRERVWVAQEALEGQPLATFSIAHEGRLVLHATYPIEFTAGRAAVHFRAIRNAAVLAQVRALVASTGYTGLIAFDFIETDQGPIAIECNPRATSGVHLFGGGPALARAILEPDGMDESSLVEPEVGSCSMIAAPMLSCLAEVRSRAALRDWLASWRSSRPVLESLSDPGPFFMQGVSLVGLCLTALRHGIGPLEASTWDIEWNGEA